MTRVSERFLRSVYLVADKIPDAKVYPFSIPAIRQMGELDLDAAVTVFVGDNGSGKSTLVEAIAVAAGFNAGPDGISRIAYEDTEHYQITRAFLNNRDSFLRKLLDG